MKLLVLIVGVLSCIGAQAADKPKDAPQANRSVSGRQSFTGCVDEQNGVYVLLDDQLGKITSLQAVVSDNNTYFAKFVGTKVQVTGTKPSTQDAPLKVTSIKQVADTCATK